MQTGKTVDCDESPLPRAEVLLWALSHPSVVVMLNVSSTLSIHYLDYPC